MRFVRCLVPALATVALSAGDAAPTTAPVTVRLADGARIQKDWDASIYAKVWADPAAKPLREKWTETMKEIEAEIGFNPIDLVLAIKGANLQFIGMQGDEPQLTARADLGAFAAKVMGLIAKDGNLKPVKVAGADEALGDDKGTIARFGTVIAVGVHTAPVAAPLAGDSPADAAVDLDAQRLVDAIAPAIPAEKKAEFDKVIAQLKPYLGNWTYRGDIVAEGIRERLSGNVPSPGVQAVDRAILARLPATTLLTLAWGFDGKAYWKAGGEALLTQIDEAMHPGATVGTQATAQAVQEFLAAIGIQASLQQIVEGFSGTGLIAITQGAPFPAITLALPRSAASDQLIGVGLQQLSTPMPDEGATAAINLPNVPIPISLIRDKGHWVLTSDLTIAGTWTSGSPGGFADTAAAKTLYAKAPAHSYLLGAADTPAVLRTIQGYLGLALAGAESLTPEQKQAISGAVLRLAGAASTGYLYAAADGKRSDIEARGLLGLGAVPLIGGVAVAQAVMRHQMMGAAPEEAKPEGPEQKAIANLESVVFPAEIQFQSSAYLDQDGDKTGEYATLAELTGTVPPAGKTETEALFAYKPGEALDGYIYAIYLPDGKGGALSSDTKARKADKAAADAQEQHFVIYAWPADKTHSRMFAIDQSGAPYEQPFTGEKPVWNSLYGGQGWDSVPAWQSVAR